MLLQYTLHWLTPPSINATPKDPAAVLPILAQILEQDSLELYKTAAGVAFGELDRARACASR